LELWKASGNRFVTSSNLLETGFDHHARTSQSNAARDWRRILLGGRWMEPYWAVLRTRPRQESLAAQSILAQGVEAYVPKLPARRSTEPEQPLFPGYLFANVDPDSDDLLRIRSAPGVSYVLPQAGPPALLRDATLDEIRTRLVFHRAQRSRKLEHGDRVTIVSGPLRWHDALFDRHLNAAGRVRILLDLVERTVPVDVDQALLKRVA
jgi:transcriptional antiterminator RfaH